MGSEKFSNSAKSGYNKGTIRSDIRYLVVSKDVRRHRLISISYISRGRCHGRGRSPILTEKCLPPWEYKEHVRRMLRQRLGHRFGRSAKSFLIPFPLVGRAGLFVGPG